MLTRQEPPPSALSTAAQPPRHLVIAEAYRPPMPRLSTFYGIVIYMYWADHAPPHFHAIYSDTEAQIGIEDGQILAGSLPRTAIRLVGTWAQLHRLELLDNWRRAQANEDLQAIDGLR
ncbi:MAG TPA: DUF4160 domain-containing protein [Mycobacteriales bacterium]|nr:DUF4160 domain-containing protein [Mycobacteriales bacterium]